MNDNARKWVDALRSGEFGQTTGRLHVKDEGYDGYCCLGVACEVYRRETGRGQWVEKQHDPGLEFRGEFGHLPRTVREWLDLKHRNGAFRSPGHPTLVRLNDSGTTFNGIADLIESEPEGLFR